MELNILLHTDDYRGDHSSDVAIAVKAFPGETVEKMAARLLKKHAERLEIRVVKDNA